MLRLRQHIGMHLSEYLSANDLTATDFAVKIKRHKSTVTRLVKRASRPDHDTMQRILDVTGGAVTPNDFFEAPAKSTNRKRAS